MRNDTENKTVEDSFLFETIIELVDFIDELAWVRNFSEDLVYINKPFATFFNIEKSFQPVISKQIKQQINFFENNIGKEVSFRDSVYIVKQFHLPANNQSDNRYKIFFAKNRPEKSEKIIENFYLNSLLANIPYLIYFKDKNSRFTLINKNQAEFLGLNSPDEAIGKWDFDFFPNDHSRIALDDEINILKSGRPIYLKTEKILRKDGTHVWMNTTKAAIKNDKDQNIGIVGISYDITDKVNIEEKLKKAKEKAEESDQLKTAFLANMSHEIRTPMNGIIGFLNLLKQPNLSEKEKFDFFQHIESCTQSLLNLIDDIIDISKIESGQINIIKSDLLLYEFLEEFVKTYDETRKSLFNPDIKFLTNFPIIDAEYTIHSDPYRLKQIISNLLNNAFKFTEKGHVEFGYKIQSSNIIFYIKDTGLGIPDDKKEIIFERFGQAHQSVYLSKKGTGLGLSISKNLVEMLEGEIWFESVKDSGSTFYFSIPNETKKKESSNRFHRQQFNWKNKTVLLSGPFIGYEHKLRDYLYETNINMLWTEKEDEFYNVYREHNNVDIILLECSDLSTTCKNILKKISESEIKTPVIALLSSAMFPESKKYTAPFCLDYILRPIEKFSLLNKIGKYLK